MALFDNPRLQPKPPKPRWYWVMLVVLTLSVPFIGVATLANSELGQAVRNKNAKMASWWLGMGGNPNHAVRPDTRTEEAFPLLHIAVMQRDFEMADLLLDNGALVNALSTGGFYRPLHLAASRGDEKAAAYLLKNGAKINLPNDQGVTPLHLAAMNGKLDMARLLLNEGADPSLKAGNGATAKDLAMKEGHDDVATMIEELGE